MPDFTRAHNQPPAIVDAKSSELFSSGLEPLPEKGKVIMVVVADWCEHCHDMEKNNKYITKTKNDGTPVRWMNIAYSEVYTKLMQTPGVEFKNGQIEVNGTAITNLPTAIEIVDGKAMQVARGVGLLTNDGSLNKIATAMDSTVKVQQQARAAVGDSCSISAATACTVDPKAAPLFNIDQVKAPTSPSLSK